MFKNYLSVAWRNLVNNKGLSFINIFGLAIGMAFALLIGLWIQHEISFDSFHKNINRIATVKKHVLFNGQKETGNATPLPLYKELKTNFPEVKHATRVSWNGAHSLIVGNNKFNRNGTYVDPDYLQMFTFPVVYGNLKTALNDPNSIVLTQSVATSLFGDENPVGKSVRVDNKLNRQVTAVLKDIPNNSSLTFDFLAPYEFLVMTDDFVKNNQNTWSNNFMMNMVEIKEGVSMESLARKIEPLNMLRDKSIKNQHLILQPMKQWHLHGEYKNWVNTGGRITYVRLFGIIGVFVLLIACINFMNLATARSEKRAKEVGVRKAIGSRKKDLILQFLTESMLTSFLAFLLALAIIQLMIPLLRDIGFENIRFSLENIPLLLMALATTVMAGIIAGSYPAFYLSSFRPVKVLKGLFKQGKGPARFRKVLVVSQFAISVGLIICTVIVFQQINHAKGRAIGYNPNNLLYIESSEDLIKNYDVLKHDLLNSGSIEAVTKASQPLTRIANRWGDFGWDGREPNTDIAMDAIMTDWDLDKVAGFKFQQGRPFSLDHKTDSNAVIINAEALRVIGYKDPIGRTMTSGGRVVTIVGVVDNILLEDPYRPSYPLVILFNPYVVNNIMLRLKEGADIKQTLASIKPIFDRNNPSYPFEYSFADSEFAKKFDLENQVGKLAGIFAALAIFISCLGLFGLAMFMAERRAKEIGIRKVLGASIGNIWGLMSKEFVGLVLIGSIIASFLSYWMMNDWLQKYDYRIGISGWIFLGAGATAILIAIATVSIQALKAAFSNPVKSLRTE